MLVRLALAVFAFAWLALATRIHESEHLAASVRGLNDDLEYFALGRFWELHLHVPFAILASGRGVSAVGRDCDDL